MRLIAISAALLCSSVALASEPKAKEYVVDIGKIEDGKVAIKVKSTGDKEWKLVHTVVLHKIRIDESEAITVDYDHAKHNTFFDPETRRVAPPKSSKLVVVQQLKLVGFGAGPNSEFKVYELTSHNFVIDPKGCKVLRRSVTHAIQIRGKIRVQPQQGPQQQPLPAA